jgi:hypothetical protein
MSVVGLTFGELFTRLCMLDPSGQVIEDGRVRSTEAAFRHRFAPMMPSTIGLTYDSRAQRLIQILSELGHSVVFGGPVPAPLCPALRSLVRKDPVPARTVARRSAGSSEPGLSFLIEAESRAGAVFVSRAWYFAGPVPPGDIAPSPEFPARRHAGPPDAYVQATKLYECLMIDPAMLSSKTEYRRVSAA